MATSFEEAKKKWLEKVGDKSWDELYNEEEARKDAKVRELMTPEYIDNWGKLPEGDE
jgi:hypothetical protein